MDKTIKIGAGRDAEVFLLEGNKVLKLYFEHVPITRIEYEFKVNKILNEKFSFTPKAYELIHDDGRKGIIFEYVKGKPLSQLSQEDPKRVIEFSKISADLLADLHKIEVQDLHEQTGYFESMIGRIDSLKPNQKEKIIKYLKTLPGGNRICHGDFHFQNVLLNEKNAHIIDWALAYRGNPTADVAKAFYILRYSMGPEEWNMVNQRVFLKLLYNFGKIISSNAFIKQYKRKTSVTKKDVKKWDLIIWAIRLAEKIPEEKPILLKKIEKALKKI